MARELCFEVKNIRATRSHVGVIGYDRIRGTVWKVVLTQELQHNVDFCACAEQEPRNIQ